MGPNGPALTYGCICQVASRFGHGGEVRGALHPPHGKGERKGHQWSALGVATAGQEYAQPRDVAYLKPNAVKSISNVYFSQLRRSKPRVSMHNLC